jgi:hypothetical protein
MDLGYGPVCNDFDAGISITRASGRGLGPGNRDFFGPCDEMASLFAISGPKKSLFPGPNPSPLALVMFLLASKILRTGPYKSSVHK